MTKEEKQKYFNELHQQLASKYQITSELVEVIRHYAGFRKLNREQTGKCLLDRMKIPCGQNKTHPKRMRRHSILWHQKMAAGLSKLTEEQYQDIVNK